MKTTVWLSVVIGSLSLAVAAGAVNGTWQATGGGSHDYTNTANWVSGRAPNLTLEPGTAAPSNSNLGIRYLSASAELLRGNATGKLAMGVDGIETFNFFCTDQVKIPTGDYRLRQIDLASPGGKAKHYVHDHRASQLWEPPYQVPVILEPNRREFSLPRGNLQRHPHRQAVLKESSFA
jgi:hypothetical protein